MVSGRPDFSASGRRDGEVVLDVRRSLASERESVYKTNLYEKRCRPFTAVPDELFTRLQQGLPDALPEAKADMEKRLAA